MEPRYAEQFERMKRYFIKFKHINDGKAHDEETQNYDDIVYAFFQQCYHLKDWVKNDPTCSGWSDVEKFITSNKDLSLCADLCNALKHLTLTKRRSTENPSFASNHITIKIGRKDGVEISINYNVSTSSGDIDAFQIAGNCVAA